MADDRQDRTPQHFPGSRGHGEGPGARRHRRGLRPPAPASPPPEQAASPPDPGTERPRPTPRPTAGSAAGPRPERPRTARPRHDEPPADPPRPDRSDRPPSSTDGPALAATGGPADDRRAAARATPIATPSGPARPDPSPRAGGSGPRPEPRGPASPYAASPYAATSTLLADLDRRWVAWKNRWTWARTAKMISGALATLVLLTCGLAWGAGAWLESAIRDIGALDPNSSDIQDAAAQAGDQNFLVVGSDTRVGAAPNEDVGTASEVPGARSDTVMVVHVPEDRSRATIVSFPRDLEITRPTCERWDSQSGAYTGRQMPPEPAVKLNTAYQVGGPRCVTRVVQQLTGLAVNHFLAVDFQGFKDMVDAVGGVPLCIAHPIHDQVLGTVAARAGPTMLAGDQALNYVRARHVVGDPTSDYGRIERQQRFLAALLRSSLSAGTLFDVGKMQGLMGAVSRSTYGDNVGTDQLLTLARSVGRVDTGNVTFTTVPTTGVANDRGNEVLRPADNQALFAAVLAERPLPGAGGAPPPPALAPDLVTVRVLGGTSGDDASSPRPSDGGRGGVHTAVSALRGYGYRAVPDDGTAVVAPPGVGAIRFSPDEAAAAASLARALPGVTMTPTVGAGSLDLVLGTDFTGKVTDPTAPPPPPPAPSFTAADAACT